MRIGPTGKSERALHDARRAARLALPSLVALLLFRPSPAAAQDDVERSRFSFDVFGTLGLVHSSEDQADFLISPVRPDGPGASDSVSFDVDSSLGGQVTFDATSKLTAVVQVVAEQTSEDDYQPDVEWANLRYDLTPELSVRAGRFALPAFIGSEYRKVSFANPWVRPPVELYSLVPVTRLDGIGATYRWHAWDWTTTLDATFGSSTADLPNAGSVEAEGAWNASVTIERGGFTGRTAVAHGELDVDAFDPLFDAFRAFGPEGETIADRFEVDDTPFSFASLGLDYDRSRWFIKTEAGWGDFDSVLGERVAGYVTAGYRWQAITPYATYSRSELLSDSSTDGLTLAGLPPPLVPVAAGLNAALDDQLRATPEQQNLALGGRWDVRPGIAVKLQVDFIDRLDRSSGTFGNRRPGFEPGGSARLVSLAAVFVF